MSKSVSRFPLNDQVTAHIREQVLSGELLPGTRMVQTEWAKNLGTSRMPVRDAFLRLQSEGILTGAESGTASVAFLSEQDIRDAYTVNAFVASLAARRAATNITRERERRLEFVHARFASNLEKDDIAAAIEANHDFHREVNLQSNSPRLVAILKLLTASLPHLGTRTLPSWRKKALCSHGEILDALRLGASGAENAADLMEAHIMEAAQVVVEHLRNRGFWSNEPADISSLDSDQLSQHNSLQYTVH